MALTKEQVQLITVAAFGVAPGTKHVSYFTKAETAGEFKVNGGKDNIKALGLTYDNPLEAVAAVLQHEGGFIEGKFSLNEATNEAYAAQVAANLGAESSLTLLADLNAGLPRYKALVKFAEAELAKGPIAAVDNAKGSLDDVEKAMIQGLHLSADKNDQVVRGAEDDLIKATIGKSKETTLHDTDNIDGGAGNDTLDVKLGGNFGGFKVTKGGGMQNVENVELTSTTTATFNATGITGVETYVLNAAKGAIQLSEIADTSLTVKVNGQAKGDLKLDFVEYDADGTKSVANAEDINLSLELSNAGTAEVLNANGTVKTAEERVVVAANVETLDLKVEGANFVNLDGTATKILSAEGTGSLKVTDVADTLTIFDAAGVAGKVTADLTTVTNNALTNVVTGAGDDVVSVSIAGLNGDAVLDGGEGTNSLSLTGEGSLEPTISNFQTLSITANGTADVVLAASKISDVATLNVTATSTGDVLIADLEQGELVVNTNLGSVAAKLTLADAIGELTLNLATAGGTNSKGEVSAEEAANVTVNVGGQKTTSSFTLVGKVETNLGINLADEVNFNVAANKNATGGAVATSYEGVVKAADATMLNVNVADKLATFKPADTSILVNVQEINLTGKGSVDLSDLGKTNGPLLGNPENDLEINAGSTKLKLGAITSNDITIESNGNLDFASAKLEALNGDINITLTGLGKLENTGGTLTAKNGTITLDLSGFKGEVSATPLKIEAQSVEIIGGRLSANAFEIISDDVTFTGGLLDDVAVVTLDKDTASITFDGGIGEDTLVLNTADDGNISSFGVDFDLTSVETLSVFKSNGTSDATAFIITAEQSVMLESVEKLYFGASGSASAVTIKVGNEKDAAGKVVSFGKEAVGTFGADAFTINTSAGVANTDVFNITNFTVNSGATAGAVDTIVGFGSALVTLAASGSASAGKIVSFNNTGNALSVADIQAKFDASGATAMKLASGDTITFIDQVGKIATLYSVKGVTDGKAEVVTLLGTVTADAALTTDSFA